MVVTLIILGGIALSFGFFVSLSKDVAALRLVFMFAALWLLFFGFMWAKLVIERNLAVDDPYSYMLDAPIYMTATINSLAMLWYIIRFMFAVFTGGLKAQDTTGDAIK